MAVRAVYALMLTNQLESGLSVIEDGRLPRFWNMTATAVISELSLMRIIIFMADGAGKARYVW